MRRREFIALLGSAAASPLASRAQQSAMPVIGWLSPGSPETDSIAGRLMAFRRGLNEMGYVEGQNIAIEYRWAEGQYDRAPELAADLVRRQVSVIAAVSAAPMAFAAKAATTTIPIVFSLGLDPVKSGLVASLNRPGGNITGSAGLITETIGKRLDLLHELLPTASRIALLVNPANPVAASETTSLEDTARTLGLQLRSLEARTPSEIDAAFETLVGLQAGGLVVGSDPLFTNNRAQVIALSARHAVPAVYAFRLFPEAGGLISHGADIAEAYRQTGVLTGKILKGANPADLPVQQVVKLELVINLNTAKALGLTIPPHLLARADEVIE
jgi:putative ABC transport system substrate-binding protein